MAEARSAVREPRVDVLYFEEGKEDEWKVGLESLRRSCVRRFYRTRNLIWNGLWPTSSWNLLVSVAFVSFLMVLDFDFCSSLNNKFWTLGEYVYISRGPPYYYLKVLVVSLLVGVCFFISLLHVRRYLLRILLAYKGWLHETPKNQSWSTLGWAVLVRIISGQSFSALIPALCPSTYSYQLSLPRMPVPSLDDTISQFLASMKPLLDTEEYNQLQKQAKNFKRTVGPKLQRLLHLKAWWASNYITDWWEKYIYLMNRAPIAVNCNYYCLGNAFWKPTHIQTARAASQSYAFMCFKRMIEREQVPPLVIRNTIPICMHQYERMFSTVRVPGADFDDLVHYDSSVSKHTVVLRQGLYYKLDMYDTMGQPLSPLTLEQQYSWIIEDADKKIAEGKISGSPSAFTTLERTDWAEKRSRYLSSGVNQETLEVVDKAAFLVTLETCEFDNLSDRAKFLLHGNGSSHWFDKSLSMFVFTDGKFGYNIEHSWGDAPVVAHLQEYACTDEVMDNRYGPDGHCKPMEGFVQAAIKAPTPLEWEVSEEMTEDIQDAIEFNRKNSEDIDLVVINHDDYGKGFVKKCKVSPDAYIQLALQLAYFMDEGKFALTYEASMTRLYLNGRTETVRPLTQDSCDFVRAMVEDHHSTEEKIRLLRKASETHTKLYKGCMSGKGWDRHLFALYVACKGLKYDSEFLHHALTHPWTLSTSQTPQQQIAGNPTLNHPDHRDKASPGGGFAPVSDEGYGVCYMLPEDSRFFFHVSSKHSCPITDSKRFVSNIFKALADMKKLFVEGWEAEDAKKK
ncbi:carnitine O-palmitoyltransferase 1, liver isoform-like [Asterias amurensis]|uniref:carnitine O-palmitoyltransferase 1, liver isoform-like n=1 Tax=Asterias amurensis TaxID=7602 RepID=UPI003AB24E0C